MQFVITGVLESLDRDEATLLCQRHGAKVVTGVSGKVTHALVGNDAGPGKLTKLEAMPGVKILSEDDLLAIIRAAVPQEGDGKQGKEDALPSEHEGREVEVVGEGKYGDCEGAAALAGAAAGGISMALGTQPEVQDGKTGGPTLHSEP